MSWSSNAEDCGEWCFRSLRFTPEAQAYLELVQSLGYFNSDSKEALIELLSPTCESLRAEELVVDRARIRARVAEYLFSMHDTLSPEQQTLMEGEWAVLFG